MNEEIEIIQINSFEELIKLKDIFELQNRVGIDIRNITQKNIRRRILDFATGIAFGKGLKIRVVNQEGVYLIYDF